MDLYYFFSVFYLWGPFAELVTIPKKQACLNNVQITGPIQRYCQKPNAHLARLSPRNSLRKPESTKS
jgi:hypothetical protein